MSPVMKHLEMSIWSCVVWLRRGYVSLDDQADQSSPPLFICLPPVSSTSIYLCVWFFLSSSTFWLSIHYLLISDQGWRKKLASFCGEDSHLDLSRPADARNILFQRHKKVVCQLALGCVWMMEDTVYLFMCMADPGDWEDSAGLQSGEMPMHIGTLYSLMGDQHSYQCHTHSHHAYVLLSTWTHWPQLSLIK